MIVLEKAAKNSLLVITDGATAMGFLYISIFLSPKEGVMDNSCVRCHFKSGDLVEPVPEEWHKVWRFGDTAEKELKAIGRSLKVLEVKTFPCACPQRNGGPHCCVLNALGCDQMIYLLIAGKKRSFSGRLFRLAAPD